MSVFTPRCDEKTILVSDIISAKNSTDESKLFAIAIIQIKPKSIPAINFVSAKPFISVVLLEFETKPSPSTILNETSIPSIGKPLRFINCTL